MGSVKLSYACSANYLDNIDALNFDSNQINYLNNIKNKQQKESIKDYFINQQFRKDYWIKGGVKITSLEALDLFKEQRYILQITKEAFQLKLNCNVGQVQLQSEIYEKILECMKDYKIIKVSEIIEKLNDFLLESIMEAFIIMAGLGYIAQAQDDELIIKAKLKTKKINEKILSKAINGECIYFLASPVTGGAINASRIEQFFVKSIIDHSEVNKNQMIDFAWKCLAKNNQGIKKDGVLISTESENKIELASLVENFIKNKLIILQGLEII
jgi:hypothetical protein